MLFVFAFFIAAVFGQASFRMPPQVAWENMKYDGLVWLDSQDDPNLPPNSELFSINGAYQYKNDGSNAFRSHMTMSFIFQGLPFSEDMWAALPANGNSYEYSVDSADPNQCRLSYEAVPVYCRPWSPIFASGFRQDCQQTLDGTMLNIVQIVTLDSTNTHVSHVRYNVTKSTGEIVLALSMSRTGGQPNPPTDADLTFPTYCPPLPPSPPPQ